MDASKDFEKVVLNHLKIRGFKDPLFAKKLLNPKKNIVDCVTYILNTVKSSGKNGFTDDEIFDMAVHYYDEEDIKIGKTIKAKVITNHQVKLSNEEIEKLKKQAREEVIKEERERMLGKNKKKKVEKPEDKPDTDSGVKTLF